jgi:hypothetical protein
VHDLTELALHTVSQRPVQDPPGYSTAWARSSTSAVHAAPLLTPPRRSPTASTTTWRSQRQLRGANCTRARCCPRAPCARTPLYCMLAPPLPNPARLRSVTPYIPHFCRLPTHSSPISPLQTHPSGSGQLWLVLEASPVSSSARTDARVQLPNPPCRKVSILLEFYKSSSDNFFYKKVQSAPPPHNRMEAAPAPSVPPSVAVPAPEPAVAEQQPQVAAEEQQPEAVPQAAVDELPEQVRSLVKIVQDSLKGYMRQRKGYVKVISDAMRAAYPNYVELEEPRYLLTLRSIDKSCEQRTITHTAPEESTDHPAPLFCRYGTRAAVWGRPVRGCGGRWATPGDRA